jgi:glutamyl-tRNA reductase
MVRTALRGRKHRPVLMVDIAVPPDITADVGELDDVYLYTVDDLTNVIEENLRSRQEAARQAEEIIDVQVERFMAWTRSLDAVPTLRAYREHAQAIGDEEVARAVRQIERGKPPQQVIEMLARNLVRKLTHDPSVNLRSAVADGETGIIDAVRTLFRLKGKDRP